MPPTTTPSPFPVIVHPYPSPLPQSYAYELSHPPTSPSQPPPRNAIVFIGGLGDGPHTVPYVRAVARALAGDGAGVGGTYSVFEARLSSSFDGYGYATGGLAGDVAEVGALVRYLRGTLGKGRIVLMGHSTGCQVG